MKSAYHNNKKLIQTTKPAMSFNGNDFAAWQSLASKKLASLLGMDKFLKVSPDIEIEYKKKIDGATEIRFSFQSEKGYRVPCHLILPDGVKKPPVMICLQGHSTGMHISLGRPKYNIDESLIKDGDRDFCVTAVKEGFAAIAMEQRNFGECGGSEKGSACFESSMTALLMGRTTLGERVWDISRLIDVLEVEFAKDLDTNTICCMGNSGGGTATLYATASDNRIKLALVSCAMCTYKDSIGAMNHCSCNYIPHIAEYFEMSDIMALICPRYFVQVSGLNDDIFPIDGAKYVYQKGLDAYKSQGAVNKCAFVTGNGGHRFYAVDAWQATKNLLMYK